MIRWMDPMAWTSRPWIPFTSIINPDLTSTNEVTWESRSVAPTHLTLLDVGGGHAGWVATAESSLLRSVDGRTWVPQALPAGDFLFRTVYGGGEGFHIACPSVHLRRLPVPLCTIAIGGQVFWSFGPCPPTPRKGVT